MHMHARAWFLCSLITLACPAETTIARVSFASFGTPKGTCRGAATPGGDLRADPTCASTGTAEVIEQLCTGKLSCEIYVDALLFGAPAPTCMGKLSVAVRHACTPTVAPTEVFALDTNFHSWSAPRCVRRPRRRALANAVEAWVSPRLAPANARLAHRHACCAAPATTARCTCSAHAHHGALRPFSSARVCAASQACVVVGVSFCPRRPRVPCCAPTRELLNLAANGSTFADRP